MMEIDRDAYHKAMAAPQQFAQPSAIGAAIRTLSPETPHTLSGIRSLIDELRSAAGELNGMLDHIGNSIAGPIAQSDGRDAAAAPAMGHIGEIIAELGYLRQQLFTARRATERLLGSL